MTSKTLLHALVVETQLRKCTFIIQLHSSAHKWPKSVLQNLRKNLNNIVITLAETLSTHTLTYHI